jgi:hypothetical protein
MGQMRNAYRILAGKPKYSSGQEPETGCCEYGNEPSDSIKGG